MKIGHLNHLLQSPKVFSLSTRILELFQRHPYRLFSLEDISDQTRVQPDKCSSALEHLIFFGLLERCDANRGVCYRADCSDQYWGDLDRFLRNSDDALHISPTALVPGVFLDRDGVVNKVVMRNGRPFSPRTINEFEWTDGVKEYIERLKEHEFLIIVVTNQPDIAKGRLSRETLDAMTELIYSHLPVDSVWICPHDDGDNCDCRKPKPGMLLEAAKRWGIDCSHSFVVGDSWKDMEAGRAAGCTSIILDRTYNQAVTCDHRLPNLKEAVRLILKVKKENTSDI